MQDDKFSVEAKQIIALAKHESEQLLHYYLGVEHLFVALTMVENGITHASLQQMSIDPKKIREMVRTYSGSGDGHRYWTDIVTTPRFEKVLKIAFKRANQHDNNVVSEFFLLHAILEEGESIPVRILRQMDVSISALIKTVEKTTVPVAVKIPHISTTRLLDQFGRDLTQLAREGKIEPVIGRKEEILHIVRILTRKTKNNPMLIGEAGVGKTAVVEGLALRIAKGEINELLKNKRIIELSLASVVAGTKYRGEFEERIVGIIEESKKNSDIVLFLDEIHTVIGAGAAEGAMDASNIIKPALARGEIRCIGATTIDEYRKHIEKDPALERRFQVVMINEPTADDTIKIMKQIKERYESHHTVDITDTAIEAAVKLSVKYVPDRRLPDKALDALDEACTDVKIPSLSLYGNKLNQKIGSGVVTDETIAEVISKWTGIPVKQLTTEEREKLAGMADTLKKRIIGQDEAVDKVTEVVKMARAGLRDPRKPLGVFLFIGPTGVGKTETAKAVAEFLFGSENDIIRLDMSEFMEKHSISKLIGAPPGYIGYEAEGQLTGKLRRKPYSMVLLDEIEKASDEIFDVFLQVFDEGRLTDAKGRTIDAKNAIFIMTSNLGSEVYRQEPIGFTKQTDKEKSAVKESFSSQLRNKFRPEFLNRIDEIVTFHPLDTGSISRIAENMLNKLHERLQEKDIGIDINQEVFNIICREGYDPVNGARPLARVIDRLITIPLSEEIISESIKSGDTIYIHTDGEKLIFSKDNH